MCNAPTRTSKRTDSTWETWYSSVPQSTHESNSDPNTHWHPRLPDPSSLKPRSDLALSHSIYPLGYLEDSTNNAFHESDLIQYILRLPTEPDVPADPDATAGDAPPGPPPPSGPCRPLDPDDRGEGDGPEDDDDDDDEPPGPPAAAE